MRGQRRLQGAPCQAGGQPHQEAARPASPERLRRALLVAQHEREGARVLRKIALERGGHVLREDGGAMRGQLGGT